MKRYAILAALSLFSLTSCRILGFSDYDYYPDNPYPDIESIVVLPFINQTDVNIEIDHFGNLCASELVKYPGFRVYRPQDVRRLMKDQTPNRPITSVADAINVARELKADAILAVAVTDYDAYNPPRMSVTVQLIRSAARRLGGGEIDRIIQSASWRRMPLKLTSSQVGHFISAFDAVYDGSSRVLQAEMGNYLGAQDREGTGFKGVRRLLMVQERFIQFVSSQFLNRLLELYYYS